MHLKMYGNDRRVLLAEALGYEFDGDELNVILGTIRDFDIPKDTQTQSLFWGMVFWLGDRYSEFKVAAKKANEQGKPIKNRLNYFCSMLKNRKENNNENRG